MSAMPLATTADDSRTTITLPYAANPPLAVLVAALRAPLVPVVGFAELIASTSTQAEVGTWAAEISASSRGVLAVLDASLALAAGRTAPNEDPEVWACAAEALAALRKLLVPTAEPDTTPCHH